MYKVDHLEMDWDLGSFLDGVSNLDVWHVFQSSPSRCLVLSQSICRCESQHLIDPSDNATPSINKRFTDCVVKLPA